MPNGELNTELLQIPATVYPGMFDRELQATITFRGREITIVVSNDDVVLDRMPPPETGLVGMLKVHLVVADDKGLLIDLPGEPLGANRRFRVPESEFKEAFAGAQMILSDRELRLELEDGHIRFEPDIDRDTQIQDASIDVRLGPTLRVPQRLEGQILAPHERIRPELQGKLETISEGGYILLPGGFVLGQTYEKVTLPLHLAARLEGKSSLARLGLLIHFTSGHIAPGFDGIIVLEMLNHSPNKIALTSQMPIGQLIFEKLSMLPRRAYGGRYSGQAQP